jgi:hypothetical protein
MKNRASVHDSKHGNPLHFSGKPTMDTFVVGSHLRPKIGEKNVHENSLENWKIDLMLVILITHSALPLIIKSKLY